LQMLQEGFAISKSPLLNLKRRVLGNPHNIFVKSQNSFPNKPANPLLNFGMQNNSPTRWIGREDAGVHRSENSSPRRFSPAQT
ncbi:MAG: hypothetical protein KDA84_07005, partial [Planctomycetaceae bacterium]|nr:hypothetical protein [Planctomycetaceae bacterium]